MNRFIKKNLFLVGVLAISATGILILLGMSAMKFFEMNKYQSETQKMTDSLNELNNRMRTPIPPFRKNVKLVQEDTEGYKKLKRSIQDYFGQTLQGALTVFVQDLRSQSMDKLFTLVEMVEKSDELAKLKKEFADAGKAWHQSIAAADKYAADLNKAYKDLKAVENNEDTQAEKAKAVEKQLADIADLKGKFDASLIAKKQTLQAARAAYSKALAYMSRKISSEQENEAYRNWAAKNKDDDKELKFYYEICSQDLTPETLRDTFVEYWNSVKDQQPPRKKIYFNFRLERGATLEQPANSKNKPVLWDTEMWNNSMVEFVKEAQKTMLEKIDDKNKEEIFLAAFGLLRNLDKNAALVEAHSAKMNALIKGQLEKGNVFISGVNFGKTALALIKSNKGFVDTSNARNAAAAQQQVTVSSENTEAGSASAMLTAEPSDVIRNWDIISDISRYMVTANIDQLEQFGYVDLAGNSSNGNYKKYSYVITLVSRESQIRTFMELLSEAYKNNRMYVIKRFSMQKQEDQIQDIIDYASGIIGKDNQQVGKENEAADDSKNSQVKSVFFKESGNYPECVAGRSTFCRITLVVDYVETTGNQLK